MAKRVLRLLRQVWWRALAGLSSPCPLCLSPSHGGKLCQACDADVLRACARLPSLRLLGLDAVFAASAYAPPADILIRQYKTQFRLRHARLLADRLVEVLMMSEWRPPPGAVLVPVPSSRRSLRRRGFNPARELSRHLRARLALPEQPDWLRRRETPRKQAALDAQGRRAILDGVFYCPQALPPCMVLLVDDVVTTGSTAMAAAAALRAGGCASVTLLVAAQVP